MAVASATREGFGCERPGWPMVTMGRGRARTPPRCQWWEPGAAHGPQSQEPPWTVAEQTSSRSATAMTAPMVACGSRGAPPAAWMRGALLAYMSYCSDAWLSLAQRYAG